MSDTEQESDSQYDEALKTAVADEVVHYMVTHYAMRDDQITVYDHYNWEAYVTIEISPEVADFDGWDQSLVRQMTSQDIESVFQSGNSVSIVPANVRRD